MMNTFTITPAVDAAREFLEIASDFTNPLEVVREAISNSMDAGASSIAIDFRAEKSQNSFNLNFTISDNGSGMSAEELQAFFDLGNSTKRDNQSTIGEKGHGTKVYFNCSSITVTTTKSRKTLRAEMSSPCSALSEGKLPLAKVSEMAACQADTGTEVSVVGLNSNQMEIFTHERLKDYILWFTKFGSCESMFGHSSNANKKLMLRGLDRAAKPFEEISFGHRFPSESKSITELFEKHVVKAPDYYAKKL